MSVSGLVFIVLSVLAGVVFILFIVVLWRYRRDRLREDLRTSIVLLVIAMAILGMNLTVVQYDSIRYYAVVIADGEARVTIPVPNEQAVFDELRIAQGTGDVRIVRTDRGTGLEISFASTISVESEVFTRPGSYDHSVDLMNGDNFFVYLETVDSNVSVKMREVRIIHESPFVFYSDQVMYSEDILLPGWNAVEYEIES